MTVKNIDKIYQLAKNNLNKYIERDLEEKEDHDHTWKDFRMEDPFGFYLRFTELLDWGQK